MIVMMTWWLSEDVANRRSELVWEHIYEYDQNNSWTYVNVSLFVTGVMILVGCVAVFGNTNCGGDMLVLVGGSIIGPFTNFCK